MAILAASRDDLHILRFMAQHAIFFTQKTRGCAGRRNPTSFMFFMSGQSAGDAESTFEYVVKCIPAITAFQPEWFPSELMTLLHIASAGGSDRVVSWLLKKPLEAGDRNGWPQFILISALSLAINLGHPSVAKTLIEYGAPTEGEDWSIWDGSALLAALSSGDYATAELVIERGDYDLSVTDEEGFNPFGVVLHCRQKSAAQGSDPDINMHLLRILLRAENALTTPVRAAPISGAGLLPLHAAILEGGYEAAIAILDAGADPRQQSSGYQPLHCVFNPPWSLPSSASSERRCLDSIATLIEHGADVNALDDSGENALHWAVKRLYGGSLELNKDSDPTVSSAPPMIKAVESWNKVMGERHVLEVCELLLKHGCNPAQVNNEGEYALELFDEWSMQEEPEGVRRALLRYMDDDRFDDQGFIAKLVLFYLQNGDSDGIRKTQLLEDACRSRGRKMLVPAAQVIEACRSFPATDRLADVMLAYFRWVTGFAERNGIIRGPDEAEEEEEKEQPGRELREYLLAQEAAAVAIIRDYPWMFPNLFPTVRQSWRLRA
ncbi:ankyrin repeat-containing domain protein [Coniochaeta sp. 2T2.1]|nr:ankyrin repeat-containing domain protein [Coniochaeta sp. 2T2.1]